MSPTHATKLANIANKLQTMFKVDIVKVDAGMVKEVVKVVGKVVKAVPFAVIGEPDYYFSSGATSEGGDHAGYEKIGNKEADSYSD